MTKQHTGVTELLLDEAVGVIVEVLEKERVAT